MGSVCPRFRKGKLEQPTIEILDSHDCRVPETFISFKLYQPKMDLDCDGVIIAYLGNYLSLVQHPLIKSLKLKNLERLKVAYQKHPSENEKVKTSWMLDNPFEQLDLDGFILANYPMWSEKRIDEDLYTVLEQSLMISESFEQRSVSLAYFEPYLGIPMNVGVRVMIGTLLERHRAKGVKYSILFEDQSTMEYCLRYASTFTGEISATSVTTEY